MFALLEATNSHSCCASTSLRRNSNGVESSTILICVINLRKLEVKLNNLRHKSI
ncbi:MAG: hypothetical protein ACTS43_00690 [Candidatus Hodgkinia cicadicola]